MAQTRSLQINMSEGPIARQMLRFSLPLILGDFLQLIYNTTDMLIVGNFVGKQALAAVGSTATIINVFIGFFAGISLGATVLISRCYGAADRDRLKVAVRTTLWLTTAVGLLITCVGYTVTPLMLRIMGTTDDVISDATTYLKIYFLGSLAQVMYNMCAGILRAVGDSRRPMYILALSTATNIVLDLYFIRSLGMGVAGAALATIIAQFMCIIFLMRFIYTVPDFQPFSMGLPSLDSSSLRVIFRSGLPFAIQRAVVSMSNTLVLSYIYRFGSSAMAAWSIYSKVDQILILTMQSIATAITTFVSQNIGAGKPERVHKGLLTGMALSLGIWAVCSSVFILLRVQITSLFNRDSEVIAYASVIFVFMMVPNFVCNVAHSIFGALRGQGHSQGPMWITIMSLVVIRQIYLHVFWPYFQSFRFVISAYPVVWSFMMVGGIVYALILKKKDSDFVI